MREMEYSLIKSLFQPSQMALYGTLHAWQACHNLVLTAYRLTKKWPEDEKFGLIAQARRAAFFAAANIVEGNSRRGAVDFARFLNMSVGSLAEVEYCIRCAKDLGYLDDRDLVEVQKKRAEAGALRWRLYAAVAGRAGRRA
jgi:four helix bundle protein